MTNGTLIMKSEEIDCPSQGPGSMFQTIFKHPILLLNGFLNIAYYTSEAMLYKEPLGLVLLVMGSLFSTFLLNPLSMLLGIRFSKFSNFEIFEKDNLLRNHFQLLLLC